MSASISPNVIAELNASGDTVREYIWLPEAEIAPTRQGRAQVDRPIAAITGVNTASPATLYVHVDHLNRPVSMTNASKASVWDAVWTPWGAPYSIIGSETLDARFPGQWFQLEAGLNYNWHRHYDPTTGRYTQPDPLGFIDGPSVYAYAENSPQRFVDKDGRQILALPWCYSSPLAFAACTLPPIIAMCMATRPPGYWDGPKGAEEWGRRNNKDPRDTRRKFHDIKQNDPGSRGDDDYSTNPDSGDVIGPDGESAGNLGD